MNDEELAGYRKHSNATLIQFMGEKPESLRHIAARRELDRRAGAFGRRMSISAFIVSVVAIGIAAWSASIAYRALARSSSTPPPSAVVPAPR